MKNTSILYYKANTERRHYVLRYQGKYFLVCYLQEHPPVHTSRYGACAVTPCTTLQSHSSILVQYVVQAYITLYRYLQ